MPRPFPFTLGIGTDICHVPRIYRILTKSKGSAGQFVRKTLNPREVLAYTSKLKVAEELDNLKANEKVYSENQSETMASKVWPLANFLGGRWAAKEAAIKAHTRRRLTMHDITILGGEQEEGGSLAPTMTVKTKGETGEEQVVKISISHDGEYATAVCLAAERVGELGLGMPT